MSQAGIQKLNELLQTNDEAGQKLADAISAGKAEGNLQAFIAMAKQHGCEISADDARAILEAAVKTMSTRQDDMDGELSDDDLDQVAGGVGGSSPGPSVTNKSTLKIATESSQLGTTPEMSTTDPINVSTEETVADVADDVLNMDDEDVVDVVSGGLDQAADFMHAKSDDSMQSATEHEEAAAKDDSPYDATVQHVSAKYATWQGDFEEDVADTLDDASDGVKLVDDHVGVFSPADAGDVISGVDQHFGTDSESILADPTQMATDSEIQEQGSEVEETQAEEDFQEAVDSAKSAADGVQDRARDAQGEVEDRARDAQSEAEEQWNNLTGNDDEEDGSDGGSDGDSDNDGIPDIIEDNSPF